MEKKEYLIIAWADSATSIKYKLTEDEYELLKDISKKLEEAMEANYQGYLEIKEV